MAGGAEERDSESTSAPRVGGRARLPAEPVALLGMSCRLPGASSPDALWELLREERHSIGEVPPDRWDADDLYDPRPGAPGKINTRRGGFLEDVGAFDAAFFGIAPREAVRMDPQQRLVLEATWEAFESAGIPVPDLVSTRTGVFVGISSLDYAQLFHSHPERVPFDPFMVTGNAHSIAANRISYLFDLRGPSLALDTGCSSSSLAIHLACQSLRLREADLAVAGGVNIMLTPELSIAFARARMLSADGRCKAFDQRADGYVRSEGCAMLVLKRLDEALRDGDPILGVIRGTAVNQDGRTAGITAPSVAAQREVIRAALAEAQVDPREVSYVEAHGTGTKIGDPVEVTALAEIFGRDQLRRGRCVVGSVKANVGHTETVSGAVGLIKLLLCLRHELIPRQLHLREVNRKFPPCASRLVFPTQATPWPRGAKPRIAGLNSFGFGGANVHLVIEEPPQRSRRTPEVERPRHLLALSAKTDSALGRLASRFRSQLAEGEGEGVADLCFSANAGRAHFGHRLAVSGRSRQEMVAGLDAFLRRDRDAGLRSGVARKRARPKLAFLFTGQGAQYPGMGRALYETQPAFRGLLDRAAELLRGDLERDLRSVMFDRGSASRQLGRTEYAQPALFALEYALAQLWRSWGVEPDCVLGHSLGEYTAACVAGAMSLEAALRLVARRGRLMQAPECRGKMAAVFERPDRVRALFADLENAASVAALNGPRSTVISGRGQAIEAIAVRLEREGIRWQWLPSDTAFHSPCVAGGLGELEEAARRVEARAPRIPLISNLTGAPLEAAPEASYWRRQARDPVRFAASMETLASLGCDTFLELGPHPTLLTMGRGCLSDPSLTWAASLRRGRDDWEQLLDALGKLYTSGIEVDWSGFDREYGRVKVGVPTYPFERERHWLDDLVQPTGARLRARSRRPPEGRRLRALRDGEDEGERRTDLVLFEDSGNPPAEIRNLHLVHGETRRESASPPSVAEWFYETVWTETARSEMAASHEPARDQAWLFLADRGGLARGLAARIAKAGGESWLVHSGNCFRRYGERRFQIDAGRPEDLHKMVEAAFPHRDGVPREVRIAHLWTLDAETDVSPELLSRAGSEVWGGVVALLQILGRKRHLKATHLYLVTRNVHLLPGDTRSICLTGSLLWGLGRVVALEHPGLRCVEIDVRPEPSRDSVEDLVPELLSGAEDDQVALRPGRRFVTRLQRLRRPDGNAEKSRDMEAPLCMPEAEPFRLELEEGKRLHGLVYRAAPRRVPPPGAVEVEVEAAGLNFRDVLCASGMYPGGPTPLGSEFAGVVTAVGEGVLELQRGDPVFGFAPWSFGSHTVSLRDLVFRRPPQLTAREAAAIPVAFLTGHYALQSLARLRAGERVLIHAAAGGVGLAAVKLAQRAGAEVFGTAGSPEKREFLASLGVEHVTDSRSLDFAEEILEATKGEGVDVVLNSLAGEYIPRSLALLRSLGRFVEIGKADIMRDRRLGLLPFRNNLSFFAVDLDAVCRERSELARSLFLELVQAFERGELAPPPVTEFSADQVAAAFRYMARRENIGKVVIAMRARSASQMERRPGRRPADASYVIAGGCGGLGLHLARWLVDGGVRTLVLLGRSGASADAEEALEALRARGARIRVVRVDVANACELARVLDEVRCSLPPIRGVIHAAGVTVDRPILKMGRREFEEVLASKVQGAWNLHRLTLGDELDLFLLCSSVASVLGSPGQANYAAANAFVDALARYRRARGLCATAINWGAWSGVGLAARAGLRDLLARRGLGTIEPEDGLRALDELLARGVAQAVVAPVDWPHLVGGLRDEALRRFMEPLVLELADVAPRSQAHAALAIPDEDLAALPEAEGLRELVEFMRAELGAVMGTSPEALHPDLPLAELGVDSLMLVELVDQLETGFDVELVLEDLQGEPTLWNVARLVLTQVLARAQAATPQSA